MRKQIIKLHEDKTLTESERTHKIEALFLKNKKISDEDAPDREFDPATEFFKSVVLVELDQTSGTLKILAELEPHQAELIAPSPPELLLIPPAPPAPAVATAPAEAQAPLPSPPTTAPPPSEGTQPISSAPPAAPAPPVVPSADAEAAPAPSPPPPLPAAGFTGPDHAPDNSTPPLAPASAISIAPPAAAPGRTSPPGGEEAHVMGSSDDGEEEEEQEDEEDEEEGGTVGADGAPAGQPHRGEPLPAGLGLGMDEVEMLMGLLSEGGEEEGGEEEDEEGGEEEGDHPGHDAAPHVKVQLHCLGCKHYLRPFKLECAQCKRFYVCRWCHDGADHSHTFDRATVTTMYCMACRQKGPVGGQCSHCGLKARYYCDECHLIDCDPVKEIFHCAQCGICRVGQREAYFHCATCSCCYPIAMQGKHVCIRDSLKKDCPVCLGDMFHSREGARPLPCGHFVHVQCFSQMLRQGIETCPLCSKLVYSGTFREQWEAERARDIRLQPMPPEIERIEKTVCCNECGNTFTAPMHFCGYQCPRCHTHNTREK
ncbi:putative CHY and RING finger domain protein [Paratrimastix pyriformis]|uniref:CHY and RING finger domain protein n=1 Tax=Paratrimastix pyriformis TaxID=342808 RepID=A0ABQ8UHD3_9EUKA|nr:putative CHY and RING finger domain protein [Paratrimastix pyriformis]